MHNTTPSHRAATIYLAAACVASTLAVVLGALEASGLVPVPRGVFSPLAAACAVAGLGYINRSAENRIGRREAAAVALILDRIDQLDKRADGIDAKILEQGEQGYAAGFVDGAAGNRRHLTAVGDA